MKYTSKVLEIGSSFCQRRGARLMLAATLVGTLLVAPALAQKTAPVVSCESLAHLALQEATITMAQPVAPGEYIRAATNAGGMPGNSQPAPTNRVAFCRVAATLKPSGDSDIKVEVWLPQSTWNGKFLGVGNGGFAGTITYTSLLEGLDHGYASASTDTGHDTSLPDGAFALGHPDKEIDFGYRAVHAMTLAAKTLVKAYYGVAPTRSYWNGCSYGGQQALTEVQRFPEDYNGIVAGSPAAPIAHLNAWQLWPSLLISKDPAREIPQSKFAMIHQAVLKECDELDGVKDGILENPEACHFDPQELLCKGGDAPDCLTAPQVYLMQQLYAGITNSQTHERIYAPLARGAEIGVAPFAGKNAMSIGLAHFKYTVFQDPNWDWKTLDPDRDVPFADKVLHAVNDTTNANLKPFFDRGGKLLMYHGWIDYSSPRESFDYRDAVLKTVGPEADNSIRVFSVPGMGHCSGGDGCDVFDKLAAIDQWVESGKAPERIVASKLSAGKVIRTHPICAYPRVAKYKGSGSMDDAENFVCAKE